MTRPAKIIEDLSNYRLSRGLVVETRSPEEIADIERVIGMMIEVLIRTHERKGIDLFAEPREKHEIRRHHKPGRLAMDIRVMLNDEVKECRRPEYKKNLLIAQVLGCSTNYVWEVRKRWKEGKST